MIEQIRENLFKMEIPLPGSPLKAVNSYVIKDSSRNLIVDTGLNRKECRDAIHGGLQELDVDLRVTDFFITHLHADHFALVSTLATNTSKVYFNQPDLDRHVGSNVWDDMVAHARANGFPEKELQLALKGHPGYKYGSRLDLDLTILGQGDTIEIGRYLLECIATPGHTRGHTCLYERNKKILFSGDHILGDITPNIQSWSDEWHPLHKYLASLEKTYALDVETVLPGHRRIFKDCKGRIRELIHHHRNRADEAASIVGKGPKTAFKVASEMTWDIDCKSWEDFPVAQKWFATGEAIAHLKYLADEGRVKKGLRDGVVVYSN